MKKKLVFLDIDGTLVDKNEHIHKSTIEAVKLAKEKGHKLFISTGRAKYITSKKLFDIGFSDGVYSAGASIFCDGKEIFHRSFSPQAYDKIIDVLRHHKALVVLEKFDAEQLLGETYREVFKTFLNWLTLLGGTVVEITPKADSHVDKFVYMGTDVDNVKMQEEFGDICKIVTMSYNDKFNGGEIMLPEINKAFGIQKVLDYYGMDVADTIAIGDGANDIEMLKFCGTGIAMGNADERAKACADYITDRIDNGGLYKAFEHCGLFE